MSGQADQSLRIVVTNAAGAEQCRCTVEEFVADNAGFWGKRWEKPEGARRLVRNITERIEALGSDELDCGAGGLFTLKADRPVARKAGGNAVKIGPDYFAVADLGEAVACWEAARDQNGWGASDAPSCTCCIERKLYRISYNGRIWDGGTGAEVALPGS